MEERSVIRPNAFRIHFIQIIDDFTFLFFFTFSLFFLNIDDFLLFYSC